VTTTPYLTTRTFAVAALLAAAVGTSASLAAQTNPVSSMPADQGEVLTTVYGSLPPLAEMEAGPRVTGIISARKGSRLQITADDGSTTMVTLHPETEIRTRGGFLGIGNKTLDQSALMNGLPVIVKTSQ
jgi:outer membrane lipoprotein SlyB